ncbi:MAG: hypothetical protein FWG07_00680 [Treponema sp.]|nr:hypothetical protein [Treponema sp.]
MRCHCGKDLRSCRHCKFYLSGSRGDCSEPNAEKPADKERGNFCDWFSLDSKFRKQGQGQIKEQDKAATARTAFDDLFK